MNASELLASLTQQGIQLWADNDKLSIRSPKGVLTSELRSELAQHKAELLEFLRKQDLPETTTSESSSQGLTLQTIGRLIGGFNSNSAAGYKQPIIDPILMAQRLKVTFRPLPKSYNKAAILKFREELELKLRNYGVQVEPWQKATTEFRYEIKIPFLKLKKSFKMRVVKSGINAVIDVERPPSLNSKFKNFIAEKLYQIYSRFIGKDKEISIPKIARLTGWAVEHAAKYIEDPNSTQVITLTELDQDFTNSQIPYQRKIGIGLNILVRTFSEVVIGVSDTKLSILNMNLSDSIFGQEEVDRFVLKSLIPKIFVPIAPVLLNRFAIGQYNPQETSYAAKLVALGKELASTGLFPPGFKLSEVIKRKSHRDIVKVIVNGRTGVSYGFVAYAEQPQYIGKREITEEEWESLSTVEGFGSNEVRQNEINRRYVKTKRGEETIFQQIPDIWILSARSGSNKTDLNLESDIVRIGLKDRLFLQLPQGINPEEVDIKPSYDLYVMLGMALSAALYAPELIKNGAPMVHFHGYPALQWFKSHEYCVGVHNPSVPCGTYESGVFNFLGIDSLSNQPDPNIALVSLVEPDHGTNFMAPEMEYLIERLKDGCARQEVELGGKHFTSLKQ
ncbi:TubC N-terminal docking domain-related protein [Lyngbya aestuarii]|uniref:TubC N-terminal docking domain-related protein n=1 Tax=Lyngbya aestuarii TaxID=118322 RepID=UPI00403DA7E1